MFPSNKQHELLQALDDLIAVHGKDNPQLRLDLEAHRAEVARALASHDRVRIAAAASKVALWVKFIIDHLTG